MWWKMALRCQTRLSEVALRYASIYTRDRSERGPIKMQLWFSKLVFGSPEQFMRKQQLLLNHICRFNDSPRHTACMPREQQKRVRCGTKAEDWEFSQMCLHPTDVLPPQWMFVHTSPVKIAVQLMLWIGTGWVLWVGGKKESDRKSRTR